MEHDRMAGHAFEFCVSCSAEPDAAFRLDGCGAQKEPASRLCQAEYIVNREDVLLTRPRERRGRVPGS